MTHSHSTTQSMQTRYENAHSLLQFWTSNEGLKNTTVYPAWIGNSDCFWYKKSVKEGLEFRLVDVKANSNEPAFDHQKLAEALAEVSQQVVSASDLSLTKLDIELSPKVIHFNAFNKRWEFDTQSSRCRESSPLRTDLEVESHDGRYVVFSKDFNLWLRDVNSGEEKALTFDGEEHFVYGAPGLAWGDLSGPYYTQVRWSPDNQRIFTIQRDTRYVKDIPFIEHMPSDGSFRPQLKLHRFALPGDEHVETLRLLSIDITTGKHQQANYSQIPTTRNNFGLFTANLGWWGKDSRYAYFVDVDRYYKYVRLIEFDTDKGICRSLFEERSDTQINLMNNGDMWPSLVPLPETDELLWYSERSGWAHLYLYDLKTGRLKNTVTSGDWLVRDVVAVIAERREVFIQSGCRTSGRNLYYRDLMRVNLDTGEVTTLLSGNYDYFAGAFTDMQIALSSDRSESGAIKVCGTSPTGNFSVVTQSRVNTVPKSFIVDRDGNEVMLLETVDISGLPENWQWPEPVKMQAADGKTDIYGVIYRPSNFSPDKSYPVIHNQFNTPDFPWAPVGSFHNNLFLGLNFFVASALSELGFIVVQIDGRGGSYRDKAFKDAGYGNLQLKCMLADQVEGIKQLGERYTYMDLTRVGAHDFSGGPSVVHAMLDYPDFYKVGVSYGLHDSRLMTASVWSDMYEGQVRYEQLFPEEKANSLKGKLLFVNDMMNYVSLPASMFRVVDALQRANKDFDMLLLPHFPGFPTAYLVRRTWDYLVTHLLCEEPPEQYHLSKVLGQD